ncbi:MAG: sensor histidine kinase, partial [Ignavibacteria bacterium]|nr:sensor histidine kinase [Ignavibacteria bacterium]
RLGSEQTELVNKALSLNGLIDRTIETMRRIATELRPTVLDDLGLHAAIEWMAQDTEQRTGIVCTVNVSRTDSQLDRKRSTAMFRIFQEALTNVVRHAGATRTEISLETEDDTLLLQVSDNGRGIQERDVAGKSSLGILGMRERARIFGGSVEITPQSGSGTRVSVRIPIGGSAD